MEEDKVRKEMDACTFKPTINKTAERSSSKEHVGCNTGPGTRIDSLLKWGEEKNRKIADTLLAADPSAKKSARKLDIKDIEKSADRMHSSYLHYERKRHQEQARELADLPFKPTISEKSKKLVENRDKKMADLAKEDSTKSKAATLSLSAMSKANEGNKFTPDTKESSEIKAADAEVSLPLKSPSPVKTPNIEMSASPTKQIKPVANVDGTLLPITKRSPTKSAKKPTALNNSPSKSSPRLKTPPKSISRHLSPKVSKAVREEASLVPRDAPAGKSNSKVQYHNITYEDDPKDIEDFSEHDELAEQKESSSQGSYLEAIRNDSVDKKLTIKLNSCEESKNGPGLKTVRPPKPTSHTVNATSPAKPSPISQPPSDLARQIAKSSGLINGNKSKSPRDRKPHAKLPASIQGRQGLSGMMPVGGNMFDEDEVEDFIKIEQLAAITNNLVSLSQRTSSQALSDQSSILVTDSSGLQQPASKPSKELPGHKYSKSTLLKMMKGLNDDLEQFVSCRD